MSYYIRNGSSYHVQADRAMDVSECLPVGTYTVEVNMFGNIFLEISDKLSLPNKLYGNTKKDAERILNTFEDRAVSTGVLLSGEKGSGKTLLAKTISVMALDFDIPTLIVNQKMKDSDTFAKFIQSIDQPCIILFDEFEKNYTTDEQSGLLTLLDGAFSTKKLFVFTCNSKRSINEFLINRPSRIFYMIEFKGLEDDFIIEYCNEALMNKSHINSICSLAKLYDHFNFDILQAVVEEMNRYNEAPQEVIRVLNTKIDEYSYNETYDAMLQINGKNIKLYNDHFYGSPLHERVDVSYTEEGVNDDDDKDKEITIFFDKTDLVDVDVKRGRYTFVRDNMKLTLAKVEKFNMNKFIV